MDMIFENSDDFFPSSLLKLEQKFDVKNRKNHAHADEVDACLHWRNNEDRIKQF